jgi:hypothetical protein
MQLKFKTFIIFTIIKIPRIIKQICNNIILYRIKKQNLRNGKIYVYKNINKNGNKIQKN